MRDNKDSNDNTYIYIKYVKISIKKTSLTCTPHDILKDPHKI